MSSAAAPPPRQDEPQPAGDPGAAAEPLPAQDSPPLVYYAAPLRPGYPSVPRTWMRYLVIGWVVVLAGAAVFAIVHGRPTDREQTTVQAARPVVDEAIARVASAATGASANGPADGDVVVAVGPFERVGQCDVSVFRKGERYRRTLTAVVVPGTERALLDRVMTGLPASYAATIRGSDTAPRLVADAGYWVLLTGSSVAPGEVRFSADTGDCRPAGDTIDTLDVVPSVRPEAAAPVLEALGVRSDAFRPAAVACPGGGTTGTDEFTLSGPPAGDLSTVLGGLATTVPGASVAVSTAALFAYLAPDAQVAVRAGTDSTVVTVTRVCAP